MNQSGPACRSGRERELKISQVEPIWLRAPIPEAKQHRNDSGVVRKVETVLVRITTDEGLVGYGEARSEGGATVALINDVFAPRLVGQDPADITRLWEGFYNGTRGGHALAEGHAFPATLVRRGLGMSAIAGIDMALWDIKGQALGTPVWQLLGGKVRDRVPVYASGGWTDEDRIGAELGGYVEGGGFRAVKMRVGAADGSFAASVRRVEAAREALGPDIGLAVDAHAGYTVAEAKRFSRLVRDLDLLWFEEPVSPDDLAGAREVRAATDVPIAAGERAVTRFDHLALLDHKTVDVLQPDLAICGGITEGVRIAALATAYNVRVAAHVWDSCVLYAASLAFTVATPGAFIMEQCMSHNPLLNELAADPVKVVDGFVMPPDAPGLGIALNEDFITRYRIGG